MIPLFIQRTLFVKKRSTNILAKSIPKLFLSIFIVKSHKNNILEYNINEYFSFIL